MDAFKKTLIAGMSKLTLEASDEQLDQLLQFMTLLQKWNKAYNLTAITDQQKMLTHHLLDSLAVIPHLSGQSYLDVGTGAGFPGIPIAIMQPDHPITLLDSNGKKTRFLVQMKAELGLENVTVVHSRMESFHSDHCFDLILSRAVGEITMLIEGTHHLCCPNGKYFCMKGKVPEDELSILQLKNQVIPIQVPGLDAERHVIVINNE